MFRLVSKLKLLKKPLKNLHKASFSKLSEQVVNARTKLLAVQEQVQHDPSNAELVNEMETWNNEYIRAATADQFAETEEKD